MKNETVAAIQKLIWDCKCERCDWNWISRKEDKPKVCPKCHSPYWETPAKDGKGKAKKNIREEQK